VTKSTALLPLVQKFFDADPAVAAHTLETMDAADGLRVLEALPGNVAARIFPYLQPAYAVGMLQKLPSNHFVEIIEQLTPQQGAAVFAELGAEQRAKMLDALPERAKRQIAEMLSYPEDSAGRIMSTDFLAFHTDVKVRDAVHRIRALAKRKVLFSYVYVVDAEGRLTGVLNMRDLLLASGEEMLESVVRKDVFSISGFTDREEVANLLSKRGYFAAPVVDSENRLLGVVKTERLLKEVQEEGTEDIQKIFGLAGDERVSTPLKESLKLRLPWLHINLITAFLAAAVVALFQDVIAEITVLAVFLPVVAGQGGNAGAQSLAVVMRGLVMREISPGKARQAVLKETAVGLVSGMVIGVVVAGVSWAWKGNAYLGLVVGLGMVVNLVVAGFSGALIPLALKAMGRDPAQSANIILTTVTDVVGFFAFLGLAVLFREHLLAAGL